MGKVLMDIDFQLQEFHLDTYIHFVYKQLDQGWEIEWDDNQENIGNMILCHYFDKMFHWSRFHLDKYTLLFYKQKVPANLESNYIQNYKMNILHCCEPYKNYPYQYYHSGKYIYFQHIFYNDHLAWVMELDDILDYKTFEDYKHMLHNWDTY